jgi:hypothetical protein
MAPRRNKSQEGQKKKRRGIKLQLLRDEDGRKEIKEGHWDRVGQKQLFHG